MADRIKGITVQIGGDTSDLSESLKAINNESRQIGTELSDVQRLLKFNPQSAELLEQRQTLLNRQIEVTNRRLTELRSVEHQVQEQFQRGDIGEQQFRAFQREIIATEGRLRHFEQQAQGTSRNVKGAFKELGKGLSGAIGAAVAGAGISEVINKSLETAHTETMIRVGVQVPEEDVGKVNALVNNIKAYGVDGEAALEGVRRQFALNIDKTTEQNNAITKSAAVISKTYAGIDFTELIQETNEMAGSMEMSQEDALGMTNTLLKMGFPPDQLDIITEYGAQLKRAGYNAGEIQGIFAAGIDTKSWNIDKLMDGIKEGRIRLAEFGSSVDKTTQGLIKGTGISTGELKKWGAAVAEGGDAGKIAMGEVATKLAGIKDDVKRNKVGVQLFGTMWEDTGKKITDTVIGYKNHLGDAKKNNDALVDSVKKYDADPMVKLNTALGDMQTKLAPLMTTIANFVAKVAEWVQKNPELAATITAVVVGLGIFIGIVASAAAVLGVLDAAAVALDMALLPFIGLMAAWVLAIGLVIAIIVLLVKNWSEVKAKAAADWNELIGIFSAAGARIKAKAQADWNDLVSKVSALGQRIKAKFQADLSSFVALWVNMGIRIRDKFNADVEDIKRIGRKISEFFKSIDLKKIGHDIMQGFLNGISGMAKTIWNKAHEIASGVGKWLKKALDVSSPSKVTYEIGIQAGAGLEYGLSDSVKKIKESAIDVANTVIGSLQKYFKTGDNTLTNYFEAIQEDGDYLNDMLTHMPRKVAAVAEQMGRVLAPSLEGTRIVDYNKDWDGNNKYISVTLHSPKALDVREANKVFTNTMNKMALMW